MSVEIVQELEKFKFETRVSEKDLDRLESNDWEPKYTHHWQKPITDQDFSKYRGTGNSVFFSFIRISHGKLGFSVLVEFSTVCLA